MLGVVGGIVLWNHSPACTVKYRQHTSLTLTPVLVYAYSVWVYEGRTMVTGRLLIPLTPLHNFLVIQWVVLQCIIISNVSLHSKRPSIHPLSHQSMLVTAASLRFTSSSYVMTTSKKTDANTQIINCPISDDEDVLKIWSSSVSTSFHLMSCSTQERKRERKSTKQIAWVKINHIVHSTTPGLNLYDISYHIFFKSSNHATQYYSLWYSIQYAGNIHSTNMWYIFIYILGEFLLFWCLSCYILIVIFPEIWLMATKWEINCTNCINENEWKQMNYSLWCKIVSLLLFCYRYQTKHAIRNVHVF